MISRRRFLHTTLGAVIAPGLADAGTPGSFRFILLGDLHYDKLDHHDFNWLDAHHPGDHSQIKNYSRLTAEVMPGMFAALKQTVVRCGAKFVLQVGDLVEGLCGSEALSVRQNREALEFIGEAELGVPFLFTKGNHDVTGDGADAAFDHVLLPFMQQQSRLVDAGSAHARACFSLTHEDTQFAFFDAYATDSLDWLEATAAKRTAARLFVTVHPPVVPYGARATWHVFSSEKSASKRVKLLDILGKHEAIVLGGHLHKFAALTRAAGGGRFTQLAVSSVVSALTERPRDVLHGPAAYTGEQVSLEPQHSPATIDTRRAIYDEERKHVSSFEYANSAGFAVVTVSGDRVVADIHSGSRAEAFQTVRLAG